MATRSEVDALREAFLEGFEAGMSHQNIEWKYMPANASWLFSETRESAGLELPEAAREWRDTWTVSAYNNRPNDFSDKEVLALDAASAEQNNGAT